MSLNTGPSSHLPERALLILVELEHGPLPAAMLKRKIEQSYDISIEPAAFYKTLTRLERRGWIELADTALHPYSYCLTERGQAMLHQHRDLASQRRERIPTTTGNTSLRGGIMKLATWLVKLYPRAWRERYEVEMLALLSEYQITLLTIFDLLFGVVDARLDPHYRTEQALSALKRPYAATMIFFAALAVYLFLAQRSVVIILGLAALFGSGQSDLHNAFIIMNANVAIALALMIVPIYGSLCLITLLVAFVSMRRVIAARYIGTALFAMVCFVIPIVITLLLNTLAPTFNGIMYFAMIRGNSPFVLWIELEALVGMLLLTILRGKQAIATRRKRLLFLIILIDVLLILLGGGYLLPLLLIHVGILSLWNILAVFTLLAIRLFPFTTIGVLLLALAGSKFSEWTKRLALVTMGLSAPVMLVSSLLFLVGILIFWTHLVSIWTASGPLFGFLYGKLSIGVAGVGLLFCTLLAFAAFRTLLLASKRAPVTKEAMQELPPMEMRQ